MAFLKNAFEDVKHFLDGAESTTVATETKADEENESTAVPSVVKNRYDSFAPPRQNNHAKYYIDGCNYFYAVSVAIEQAQHSIWIMDWWLSPELYLRRPPSKNEQYRLDNMLKAAAERGVKVNVMVYKEVPAVTITASDHTKHALEDLHPTIAVFRHPDHNPSPRAMTSSVISALKDISFNPEGRKNLEAERMEALYGLSDDIVLYWAHHEKLCLIDGHTAFMGGLDLCFGRWDMHQHEIADARPTNLEEIIWPGQDYNNSRIMDFHDLAKWDRNKLDRTKDARMGWTDLSLCLQGEVVEDIKAHFVARWNWIYDNKYAVEKGERYGPLVLANPAAAYGVDGKPRTESNAPKAEDAAQAGTTAGESHYFHGENSMFGQLKHRIWHSNDGRPMEQGTTEVQLVRSASAWSHGIATEHSIQDAYIDTIRSAEHFIYIENQFFITATDDKEEHVKNQIGAAIVERIVRARDEGIAFKIIVLMPSVPAFAGDLHSESSTGTMAIMAFQYNSICRGGSSIIDKLKAAGIEDPSRYIQFFNLRNYDRINAGTEMAQVERESGVDYETARREHDDQVGAGYRGEGEGTGTSSGDDNPVAADCYQASARNHNEKIPDTVAACYMQDGPALESMPWVGSADSEMDAYVSEELYIHTKLLIADDRVIICGSANLNDRSQLGSHDSEIAVVVRDSTLIASEMAGQSYMVGKFASSLRRNLFRKHLGLMPAQRLHDLGSDAHPLQAGENVYDWNSEADSIVRDPLSQEFTRLWATRARENTAAFARAFAPVPCNEVRNWTQYQELYGQLFLSASPAGTKKEDLLPPKYAYGHVVRENFRDVDELKEVLATVRGTLVEMPLDFLCEVEELAEENLSYNDITASIYT